MDKGSESCEDKCSGSTNDPNFSNLVENTCRLQLENKAVKGLDLCSILLGCSGDVPKSEEHIHNNVEGTFTQIGNLPKSGLKNQKNMSLVQIDVRGSIGNNSTLAAIAKEFETDEKSLECDENPRKNQWDISFDSD